MARRIQLRSSFVFKLHVKALNKAEMKFLWVHDW